MNKIIVPVDFSEHSENALKTAAFLAKQNQAELLVLHMLELSNSLFISRSESSLQQETVFLLKLTEKRFETFLKKDYLNGIKITPLVKHFKVFSEINTVAKEQGADIIVMGSHGVSGLKELLIGSNTEKVIRNSDTPVLVIKNTSIGHHFMRPVFACDFSEDDIEPYKEARDFFEALGAKIRLVYVNTPTKSFKSSSEMREIVKSFFIKADSDLSHLYDVSYVSDYSIEAGILNFAKSHDADVIAMATHGRKGLAHFFDGSITEDVANHSEIPVISFKI